MRIGLISDTHGLLRPEAMDALQGCDRIVHAGDIGDSAILEALARIGPVVAVRGNNDRDGWADALPHAAGLDAEGVRVHVIHDAADLRGHPPPADASVVVAGHSHRPSVVERDGRLHVNPGSAGPRRFSLPVTVALLDVEAGRASVTIVPLPIGPARRARA
ncbi:MAG TPA: metallophosphoesterase family protein [Burkholderiaceae bacterium]|nr:metallophosphoesterase family protein [Burkholderiaceae bacterium]